MVADKFTQEIADEICRRMSDGESLRTICKDKAAGMPDKATVMRWLGRPELEAFRAQYNAAYQERADAMFEDIVGIADETTDANLGRLRVDARKWCISRMNPKKYGERVSTELSGPDGGPIEHKDMTPNDLARRIAFTLAKAAREPQNED